MNIHNSFSCYIRGVVVGAEQNDSKPPLQAPTFAQKEASKHCCMSETPVNMDLEYDPGHTERQGKPHTLSRRSLVTKYTLSLSCRMFNPPNEGRPVLLITRLTHTTDRHLFIFHRRSLYTQIHVFMN